MLEAAPRWTRTRHGGVYGTGCAMTESSKTSSDMPAGVPQSPLELANYHGGSVVSRVLLKRGGGTITFFAFDRDQGLSEHTAPFDAMAHVLEGEADFTISGVAMRVQAGEMVLLPAHEPHALSARTRFKMLLTMIRSA
jgi:quercetin dioxygenase-like cupin family protein